jgi:transmembrane sensor
MSNKSIRNRFLSIFDKYLKGKTTTEQNNLVDYFYDSIPDEVVAPEKLTAIQSEIKSAINERIRGSVVKLAPRRRFNYLKVAACLALIGLSATFIYQHYFAPANQTAYTLAMNDSSSPVIVLNDGKSYDLNDSRLHKKALKIEDNGEKVFVLSGDSKDSQDINLIKNPTNRIFAFQLQDGTRAWLNPKSTLEILPVSNGKRMVKIEGTVLFDVQKIKTADHYMPFVVKTALQTIEVLGTKFIVNSFDKDEDVLLLEGKVRLTHNNYNTAVILKPDQRASLQSNDPKILITKSTDGHKVEAWHKGLFYFENEKMSDVMAELADWYGVEIIVDRAIKDIPITGMISRYEDVEQELKMIEMTNNVSYKRSGGKIYIK